MLFNDKKTDNMMDVTIQVTGDCNLACTYCYLHDKNNKVLNIEDGKRFIEKIITNDQSFWKKTYKFDDVKGIHLQFIGGEPLCNYKAVIELCDFFKECCIRHGKTEFYDNTTFGICTNGTIYNKEIEDFILKYRGKVNISVSIDGNKQLHDACRIYKGSGKPSYDTVVKNLYKFRKLVPTCMPVNTKATISPENINFLYDAVVSLFEDLKFKKVPMNCVHENVWNVDCAKILYAQLKKVADWILDKGCKWEAATLSQPTLPDDCQLGFFTDKCFVGYNSEQLKECWCGGNGRMLFLQADGKIYNCNRYSETAIGDSKRDLVLGNVTDGITNKDNLKLIRRVTRETSYPNECKNCPVAMGCSDCVAYYYEMQGNFKKMKNLCDMHKARSLANVYFWNKYYMQQDMKFVFLMNLSVGEAKKYVSDEEVELLLDLSNRRYVKTLKEVEHETH